MKRTKPVYLAFATTFILFWVLGFLRFENNAALLAFKYLLFPFGFLYQALEKYGMDNSINWLNDEILQLLFFIAAVGGQTFVYLSLYNFVKKHFQKPKGNQEPATER